MGTSFTRDERRLCVHVYRMQVAFDRPRARSESTGKVPDRMHVSTSREKTNVFLSSTRTDKLSARQKNLPSEADSDNVRCCYLRQTASAEPRYFRARDLWTSIIHIVPSPIYLATLILAV